VSSSDSVAGRFLLLQAGAEEDRQDDLIGGLHPAEDPVPDGEEVAAGDEGLPDDEHPEEEEHHIGVDGLYGVDRGDLAGGEDGSSKQDLPDLQVEPADLPGGDQQEEIGYGSGHFTRGGMPFLSLSDTHFLLPRF